MGVALLASLILAASAQSAAPTVLIIQTKEAPPGASGVSNVGTPPRGVERPPANKETGAPFDLTSYFAGELETTGRMRPVVWSMGDPVFRKAVTDRQVAYKDEFPTLQVASQFADKQKMDYLAVIGGRLKDGTIYGQIKLYKGGKVVYEKEETMGASIGATFDIEGSARSICRTWISILADTVLKGQSVSPIVPTPDQSPGQVETPPPVEAPIPVVDNKQLREDASALLQKGNLPAALELLRDAVDQAPFDVERRTVYITLLLRANQPRIAATEARRAAEVIQESVALRAMAARAWLAAGEAEEAQEDLNQAVARDPENPETRLLLAEIAIGKDQLPQAVEHLKVAIAKAPTADAQFKLAIAHAGQGNPESAKEVLSKLDPPADEVERSARFEFAVEPLDRWAKVEGGNLVSLFQRALVRRSDPAVAEETVRLRRQLDGYLALATALSPPTVHQPSQERRLVALRLMVQCGSDLVSFLADGDQDLLADARINLGEAIRSLNTAREMHVAENAPKT